MNGAGAGIAQQGIGVLAAFTGMVKDSTGVSLGSDYLHEKMLYWQSRSAAWETLAQMGNTGVAGEAATKILGGAASTLPSLAGGVLLRAAVAPFTTSQVVLRTAAMVGASGTAAAQSAAGMYSEVYAVNRQRGMPEEQARRTALKPALIAGVITAALSYRGGANGVEAFFREEGREVLKRTLWEHAKAMGRDITEEMLEEGADTFLQELTKMVHLYPDRSMRDILSVTLDGALTGGGVAGMMVGGRRVFGGGRHQGDGGTEGQADGSGVPPYLAPTAGQMSGMERGQDLQLPSVRGQDGMARAGEANPLGAGVMHNSLDNGGTDNGAAAGAKPGDAALPGGEPLVPELVGGPKADEETGHAVPPKVNDEDRRDDDGDGKPENDEALVPEMAGGPKTDEESGHAVPPGGASGMGTEGGNGASDVPVGTTTATPASTPSAGGNTSNDGKTSASSDSLLQSPQPNRDTKFAQAEATSQKRKTYTPDGSPFPEDEDYIPKGNILPFDQFPASIQGKSNRQIDAEYDASLADSMDRRARRASETGLIMSHFIERHGEHLTDEQLEARCIWHIDPINGTDNDADKAGKHYCNEHATKFKTRRSVLAAKDHALNSTEFQDASKNREYVIQGKFTVTIPLERVFGPGYKEHVYGRTRVGAKKLATTTSRPTDFSRGGNLVIHVHLNQKGGMGDSHHVSRPKLNE